MNNRVQMLLNLERAMTVFKYFCPICWAELEGDFGEDVYCDKCDVTYETDWDSYGEGAGAGSLPSIV